jgi:hypothetical protein
MMINSQGIENSPAVIRALVKKQDGTALTQATTTSITAKVFNIDSGGQVGSDISADPATSVFDTLQEGETTQYNLAIPIGGAYFPTGNTTYSIEIKVTPTTGDPFYIVVRHHARNIFSE